MRIEYPSAKLLWSTFAPELEIEAAGRTCYKSESSISDQSAEDFVKMIMKRGHESVLEHACASFRIVTDRGITHEIVRHRLASYSQESTRYCNYGKEKFGNQITVIQPNDIKVNTRAFDLWSAAMQEAEKAYFRLLDQKLSPQMARSVLPTCLKTEIVMTCNFREWRHFLKLRLSKAAHPDIRRIAEAIQCQLYSISPTIFSGETLV